MTDPLRAAMHADPAVCNGKPHTRWKMLSKCDHIAARIRAALAADPARPVDARPGLRIAVCPHCNEELSVAADTARPGLDVWPDRAWLISHWVGHRCGYVDCRVTEQHEHGGGPPMREMTPEEEADDE